MQLVAFLFMRVVRAAQVFWLLTTDRATRRRLPWAYLGQRARRDPYMMLQLAGIAAAAVFYPASFLLPESARGLTIAACAVLWLTAALGPSIGRRFRKNQ